MTAYGYIRVSTTKQDYSSQKHVLTERFSIDEFVEDTGTGTVIQPNLQKLLDRCVPGDRICVCAIDRLGRSTQNLEAVAEKLREKQVTLMSARESGVDLLSPAGKLIFQIAGSMAESEAQINADRVRAGLGAAKERGVKLGRRPMLEVPEFKNKIEEMRQLRAQGISIRKIAEILSISYGAAYKYTGDVAINQEEIHKLKEENLSVVNASVTQSSIHGEAAPKASTKTRQVTLESTELLHLERQSLCASKVVVASRKSNRTPVSHTAGSIPFGISATIRRLSLEGLSPYHIQSRILDETGVKVGFPKIEAVLRAICEEVETTNALGKHEIACGNKPKTRQERLPSQLLKPTKISHPGDTFSTATSPSKNLKHRVEGLLARKKNVYEILDIIEAEFGVEYSIADLKEKYTDFPF